QQARPVGANHAKPGAQYNLFEIAELKGSEPSADAKWSVQFDQFGIADGEDTVTHLRRTEFGVPGSNTASGSVAEKAS
ncbi:MAG: hypothetical protein AAFO68_04630, partial [Pseudomonadota bacterium]